jgi:hypothetical protein
MDRNYVFLCGVTWCKFGQEDAAKEIPRAPDSNDPDVNSLASAMFAKGVSRLTGLDGRA